MILDLFTYNLIELVSVSIDILQHNYYINLLDQIWKNVLDISIEKYKRLL